MNYFAHLLIYLNVYIIIALSLNLLVGYCGLLTLAHAGYFAVGSYTYAFVTIKFGWGFIPAVGMGAAFAAVGSLALSLPSWRCHEDSFILISLAVQVFLFSLFHNWMSPGTEFGAWGNLTNGPFGISGIPKPVIFGFTFKTVGLIALLSLIIVGGSAGIIWLLCSSPWGRLLKSIRDNELAARGLGKNVRVIKIQAFAISCGFVAVAGALYATYMNFISPEIASIDESVLMLCMVLVGGTGTFCGPFVGALVLLFIPEMLRLVNIPPSVAGKIRLLLYGILLILMMHIRPQGIAGEYRMDQKE